MVRYDGLKNDTVKWNFENGRLPKINFPKKKNALKKKMRSNAFFFQTDSTPKPTASSVYSKFENT